MTMNSTTWSDKTKPRFRPRHHHRAKLTMTKISDAHIRPGSTETRPKSFIPRKSTAGSPHDHNPIDTGSSTSGAHVDHFNHRALKSYGGTDSNGSQLIEPSAGGVSRRSFSEVASITWPPNI